MDAPDTCCGFGGTFSVKYGEISAAILDEKLERIKRSGVDYVIANDSSCLMQIAGGPESCRISCQDHASCRATSTPVSEPGRTMSSSPSDLSSRSHVALEDVVLQTALKRATGSFIERRREAVENAPDWEGLRTRARQIKEHTINNLDYYLEQLVENVTRHGGKVFWARNGEDVNRYIIELAQARGVKSVQAQFHYYRRD